MPDIFGRERHEYQHIADMGDETFERHEAAMAHSMRRYGAPENARHDFDALGNAQRNGYHDWGGQQALEGGAPEQRTAVNAQAIGFTTDNLLAIQSMVEEILYTGYRMDEFVPVATDMAEGATSYTPRILDVHGEAKFLTTPGTEAEAVRVSQTIDPQPILLGGVDAEWTVEDIRNAMFSGIPLQSETMTGAIDRCYDHIETVGLAGDSSRGWRGLSNLTSAGDDITSNAASAVWSGLTADQIRADISGEISALITDTNEVVGRRLKDGLCIYLPGEQYDQLCDPLGDNADKSIMQWIEEMNPFTKMTGNRIKFKRLMELSNTMITTVMSNRVFEMAISIMPRVIRIVDKGRVIHGQMEYKCGRLYVKRPSYIRQLTGL